MILIQQPPITAPPPPPDTRHCLHHSTSATAYCLLQRLLASAPPLRSPQTTLTLTPLSSIVGQIVGIWRHTIIIRTSSSLKGSVGLPGSVQNKLLLPLLATGGGNRTREFVELLEFYFRIVSSSTSTYYYTTTLLLATTSMTMTSCIWCFYEMHNEYQFVNVAIIHSYFLLMLMLMLLLLLVFAIII